MASSTPSLPPPSLKQPYCDVSALEGGTFTLLGKLMLTGVDEGYQHLAPCLAFLLTHVPSGERLLFDLGVNLDEDCLSVTPAFEAAMQGHDMRSPKDFVASLKKGGLEPDDVTRIVLSHLHADHVGNPAKFINARFLVGGASRALLQPGYPEDPKSFFHSRLLPEDRTDFLDTHGEDWKPIGPFDRALDYFGDGSLYIVDAPGHLPGHINILARTSTDGGWIYLAGDSAHDWRLIRGQADIAVLHDPMFGMVCAHVDVTQAREHIRKIADLTSLSRVRVLLAHDNEWYEENKGGRAFWPGKIHSL